jgi:thioredoxin-like negative regulator of GroEL
LDEHDLAEQILSLAEDYVHMDKQQMYKHALEVLPSTRPNTRQHAFLNEIKWAYERLYNA